MKLLIDAGNTRVKWLLQSGERVHTRGQGALMNTDLFEGAVKHGASITRVAVSTVGPEANRSQLMSVLASFTDAPVCFYWTEASRGGLTCAYADPSTMGADRWHALYGIWHQHPRAFVVIDAGSAVTIDFVQGNGRHLGGYILPGRGMMLRSLKQDAARIGFGDITTDSAAPGVSTTECVQQGLRWLWQGVIDRLEKDCNRLLLDEVYVTGGDSAELLALGLRAEQRPELVLQGLDAVDRESLG